MAYDPTKYDPTKEALYRPETRPPAGLYAKGDDWPLEAICAELARLAYVRFEENDELVLQDAMRKAGFGEATCFKSKPGAAGILSRLVGFFRRTSGKPDFGLDAQAFGTVGDDGTIFVAFRGTQADRPADILVDANFFSVDWPSGGKVHKGFCDTYNSIREEIGGWVASQPKGRMVVIGHSLGAALATLMAADHDGAALVTFGSPRVGNRDFADRFAGRDVRRYVDCADMVAQVPPPLLGFVHVGEARYIDRFGTATGRGHASRRPERRSQRLSGEACRSPRQCGDPASRRPHADQLYFRRAGPAARSVASPLLNAVRHG